jgi:hypothetical protein
MKQHILIEGCDIHVILNLFIQKRGKKHVVGYPKDDENALFKAKFVINSKEISGGKSSILKDLKTSVVRPDLENLAIICDADKKPVQSTWQAISSKLTEVGYLNLPKSLNLNGTIIEKQAELPKIGIWIFPNNEKEGAVETFFQDLFPENDALLNQSKTTIQQLFDSKLHRFPEKDTQKAIVSTWLAWQAQPGRTMGIALQQKWLKVENQHADPFLDWFEQIFELE